jgi:hypothetical protein
VVPGSLTNIQAIPDLKAYFIKEDKGWFRTLGLAVFGVQN